MNANINKAREIFIEAVEKVPPGRWEAFLAEKCGTDSELRGHVKHLLQAHEEAGSFLENPAVDPQPAIEDLRLQIANPLQDPRNLQSAI